VRQSMVMMQALPAAPRTPVSFMQPPALPAPNGARASTSGSVQAGAGANKYYSPLNTNKGHGSVAMVHQLTELRSSMHLSDNGGDTQSVAASDQQAPRDKNGAAANQVGPQALRQATAEQPVRPAQVQQTAHVQDSIEGRASCSTHNHRCRLCNLSTLHGL